MKQIRINRDLDLAPIKEEIEQTGSAVIDGFLESTSADALHGFLNGGMPESWWNTSYRKRDGSVSIIARGAGSTPALTRACSESASLLNEKQFSYLFDRTTDHHQSCPCLYCQYLRLMRSDEMTSFLSDIGLSTNGISGEFFASRFRQGQFLSAHTDEGKGQTSLVLGLTRDWHPCWGGNLVINDKKVVTPGFNRLNVMTLNDKGVPHYVSQVALGVEAKRISITGWLG